MGLHNQMADKRELRVIAIPMYEWKPEVKSLILETRRQQIEEAGLWSYLQLQLEEPNLAKVRHFVERTDYAQLESALRLQGEICPMNGSRVRLILDLPAGGQTVKDWPALTNQEKMEIFGGQLQSNKKSNTFNLSRVLPPLSEWLKFINHRLFLATRPETATLEALTAGYAAL